MQDPLNSKSKNTSIAIIGLGCWYPGARNPVEFWENVLSRRQQFRRIPDVRMPLSDYYAADKSAPDKTYGTRGAFIDGFNFDRTAYRIPKGTYENTDLAHWLALEVANQALADAKLTQMPQALAERTGVIVGNTLTGEFTRANAMRLRWPYVRRSLEASGMLAQLPTEVADLIVAQTEARFVAPFPPTTEDTLAGALSNTIGGRICNYFDFGGGGYTVDGACSSSLLAVCTGATALDNHELDIALVGGVDISIDPFELVGFAKTKALSPDIMRVYDQRGNGFIGGEGCGFVVLRRLEDAIQHNNTIYAVLRGWGIASDGRGAITAPKAEGQARALRKAYKRAGMPASELHFVEGHGTGTAVGDRIELAGVATVLKEAGVTDGHHHGMTSLKSIIGHTKAAAGIGAFIKIILSANRRVLPPTAGCERPNDVFFAEGKGLYPITQGRSLNSHETVVAGASAMGFGGINTHIVVSSYDGAPAAKLEPSVPEQTLLSSWQNAEVFVFAADSADALQQRLRATAAMALHMSVAEMTDLAADLAQNMKPHMAYRAACVTSQPDTLAETCENLAKALNGAQLEPGQRIEQAGGWAGRSGTDVRVGFVYPGQGAQKLGMGRTLVNRHGWARALATQGGDWVASQTGHDMLAAMHPDTERQLDKDAVEALDKALSQTEVAQPSIVLDSLLWTQYLERLGVHPKVVAGHSLGELTAFHAGGLLNAKSVLTLAAERGRLMAASEDNSGRMVMLACNSAEAQALLTNIKGYATIANINSTAQVVVACEQSIAPAIVDAARAKGIVAKTLRVSNGFHSQLVAGAAEALRNTELDLVASPLDNPPTVMSTLSNVTVKGGMALANHFAHHVEAPVDFVALTQRLRAQCDVLLEVGPGGALTGFINDITGNALPCWPLEMQPGDMRPLLSALAQLYIRGVEIAWPAMYEERLVRPFVAPSERQFIVNPCERPVAGGAWSESPRLGADVASAARARAHATPMAATPQAQAPQAAQPAAQPGDNLMGQLVTLVVETTGFPETSVAPTSRLLDDLNMDSIKAAEFVATAAQRAGVSDQVDPGQFANATLQDIADAFNGLGGAADSGQSTGSTMPWTRTFGVRVVPRPSAPPLQPEAWSQRDVVIVAAPNDTALATQMADAMRALGAQVENTTWATLAAMPATVLQNRRQPMLLALMPTAKADMSDAQRRQCVEEQVTRLHALALTVVQPGVSDAHLVVVQRGDGRMGIDGGAYEPLSASAAGFLKALHLERKNLAVRLVDMAPEGMAQVWPARVLPELQGSTAFTSVGFDRNGTCHAETTAVLQPVALKTRRAPITKDDVVLVTGGAKGITAECAFALAEKTGAKMALVGSTPLDIENPDVEIQGTLDRFKAAGLVARYFSCDMAQGEAVASLVQNVRSALGQPTVVIHGAGRNTTQGVHDTTPASALKEMGPKLFGGMHLFDAMAAQPPKLFVALTSVIGVTGMPGNAWYAFANDVLDRTLGTFAARHPNTDVVSLAYSVWDEVGMGSRMGSVKTLARLGIDAIPKAEGVQRFLQLVLQDCGTRQPIVVARISGLDTFPSDALAVPADLRYLQGNVRGLPGVELQSRVKLMPETDPYLGDHVFRGTMLMPTVFGLEAMAQVASVLVNVPDGRVHRIDDIRLEKPLIANAHDGLEIDIQAVVREQAPGNDEMLVDCRIRAAATGFNLDHFQATFAFGKTAATLQERPDLPWSKKPTLGWRLEDGKALNINPKRDLYGGLLFQGPMFQKMDSVTVLTPSYMQFRANADTMDQTGQRAILGDPCFRDVLLHAVRIVVPQDEALPFHIGSIELSDKAHTGGLRHVHAYKLGQTDTEHNCSLVVSNDAGEVVERMHGYRLRILRALPEFPTIHDILNPGVADEAKLKAFAHLPPGHTLSVAWHPELNTWDTRTRRAWERGLIETVCKEMGHNASVTWHDAGVPTLTAGGNTLGLSITNDGQYAVMVLGASAQGVDLQTITARSQETWASMLTATQMPLVETLRQSGDDLDTAATRVWSALEAFYKATGERQPALTLASQEGNSVRLNAVGTNHQCTLKTWSVQLARGSMRVFALVEPESLRAIDQAQQAAMEASFVQSLTMPWYTVSVNRDAQGTANALSMRNMVAFNESRTITGCVPSSQLASWMGHVREMALHPVGAQLMPLFASGRWGAVTNFGVARLMAPVRAMDIIESRIWVSQVNGPATTLEFEYWRLNADSTTTQVGASSLATTWVEILGPGVVRPAPMPQFLNDYMRQLLRLSVNGQSRLLSEIPAAGSPMGPPVMSERFQTSLEESNAVGNIYFSNHFKWANHAVDNLMKRIRPGHASSAGRNGELLLQEQRIDYLREAMPYDVIEVDVAVGHLNAGTGEISFFTEYWRRNPNGERDKLAIGHQRGRWVQLDGRGQPQPAPLPADVLQGLQTGGALLAAGELQAGVKAVRG